MNSIPLARPDAFSVNIEAVETWIGYRPLMEKVRTLPPDAEFSVLLEFLVEYAGGYELADHRAMEQSREAHWNAVKAVKDRISELYRKARESG